MRGKAMAQRQRSKRPASEGGQWQNQEQDARARAAAAWARQDQVKTLRFLDLGAGQSQTKIMAHIYLLFDFAKDEEKVQQARHKLEIWKQAFRLDKKLLYKMERIAAAPTDGEPKPAKAEKAKGKAKAKSKAGAKEEAAAPPASSEDIKLFVRLGFSGHERLSEQRWVQRIPTEEPFRDASPAVVKPGDAKFEVTEQQFEDLT
jgi:hypothetical protein